MPSPIVRSDTARLYRTELLSPVPPYHRRAWNHTELKEGDLVYYGPMPQYYGIGVVVRLQGRLASVDFRGTGTCGVHEDTLERQYLIRLNPAELSVL
jgi:hypothetical protein